MKLSVIIPVYNKNEYLTETVSSVRNQTIKDFEILLIDDGSTDGSSVLCDTLSMEDDRIRVIHLEHGGVSIARNVGVKEAKGEYIGFIDGDDLIEPIMYDVMLDFAAKRELDVVECTIDRQTGITNKPYSGKYRVIDGKLFCVELFGCQPKDYTTHISLCDKIIRKELFEGIEFPPGRYYEDEQQSYKLCLKAANIGQMPDAFYHYVKRDESIITGMSKKKMLDKLEALSDRFSYLPKIISPLSFPCAVSLFEHANRFTKEFLDSGDLDGADKVSEILIRNEMRLINHLKPDERILYLTLREKDYTNWPGRYELVLKRQQEDMDKLQQKAAKRAAEGAKKED